MTDEQLLKDLEVLSDREQYKYAPMPSYQGEEFPEYFKSALDYINRLEEEKYQLEQNLGQCENGYNLELLTANMRIKSLEQDKEQIRTETAKEILTALCEPLEVWTETEDLEKSAQRKIGGLLFVKKANERIKELAKKYGVEVEE